MGEAFALQWQDLDVDRDRLTVGRSIDGQGRVRTPREGTRTIRLFAGSKSRLLALPPHEASFMFVDSSDQPLGRARLAYRWRPIAAAWEQSRPADHWIHERLRRDPQAHLSLHELRRRAAAWLVTPEPFGPGYRPVEAAYHLGVSHDGYVPHNRAESFGRRRDYKPGER